MPRGCFYTYVWGHVPCAWYSGDSPLEVTLNSWNSTAAIQKWNWSFTIDKNPWFFSNHFCGNVHAASSLFPWSQDIDPENFGKLVFCGRPRTNTSVLVSHQQEYGKERFDPGFKQKIARWCFTASFSWPTPPKVWKRDPFKTRCLHRMFEDTTSALPTSWQSMFSGKSPRSSAVMERQAEFKLLDEVLDS